MSDIKPWQIILIIAAVVVLAFSGMRMLGGGKIDQPTGHMTVDVMTGQLYLVQKGKAKGIMYPAKHPDTGERTLYPVIKDDTTGEWKLNPRTAAGISDDMIEDSKVLESTSLIKIDEAKPIVTVIKK
ncbi:MAG: hypothetical protein AB8C13_08635 [Phycisphaerales bacterium]